MFRPRLDILPLTQQRLWPQLRNAAKLGFVLYGGTAVALRLGHRLSIDFDFFADADLDREALKGLLPFIARSTSIQENANTWTLLVPSGNPTVDHVKISFFGGIRFGRVGTPDVTEDGVLQIASLDDLIATKLKVILQRAEAKDYRDVAALLDAGVSLTRGLAAARALFGPNFQPSESLKALVYFGDGDLSSLTSAEKSALVQSATAVRDLPAVQVLTTRLGL